MTIDVDRAGLDPEWGRGFGRLAGRTALVTGSTRGLGRTIAEWLAREGANIVVTGREPAKVAASVAAMRAFGAESWGIPADLAQVEEAHRLAREAITTAPDLDILVNNAGVSISQPFWAVTDANFEEQLTVNLRSPFILGQELTRNMIERGLRGRVVNVSTIGVFGAHRDKMVYNMAKAGVQAMTRNMAWELGPHGITVNCVAPGGVPDRPGTDDEVPDEYRAAIGQVVPAGRMGRAEDIATVVVFFCLPESEWTTGQTLLTDGGHMSAMPERRADQR